MPVTDCFFLPLAQLTVVALTQPAAQVVTADVIFRAWSPFMHTKLTIGRNDFGHFGATAITRLTSKPFAQRTIDADLKPFGHFGLAPITTSVFLPFTQYRVTAAA
jgi:hypothetical protein